MDLHRLRVDTVAAGFSTLAVMPLWNTLRARGMDEWPAAKVTGAALFALGLLSLGLRLTHWGRNAKFPMAVFREEFKVASYLSKLTLHAWGAVLVGIALRVYFWVYGGG